MKELVEFFKQRGLLFRSLEPLESKTFEIKKRVKLFRGLDTQNSFVLVVQMAKKSRLLQKEVQELEKMSKKIEAKLDHGFKRRFLLIQGPICSKAKEELEKMGWRIHALV